MRIVSAPVFAILVLFHLVAPVNVSQAIGSVNDPLLGLSFPISMAQRFQELPAVAYNASANEYLVVWQDGRAGSSDYAIYGQRVSTSGSLLGDNFAISNEAGNQVWPAVAWNATNNEYLVAWTDSGAGFDIRGRRLAANGTPIGGSYPVSAVVGDQMNPLVTWNSRDNQYFVVWADWGNSTPSHVNDLYGQRLEGDGTLLGEALLMAQGPNGVGVSDLIWNPTVNEYFLLLSDGRRGLGTSSIFGRRLTASGAAIGAEVTMPTTQEQMGGSVAWSSSARQYLVVWQNGYRDHFSIAGQRIDPAGILVGDTIVVTNSDFEHWSPDVVFNSTIDVYQVVWSETHSTGGWDVYSQMVATDGTLVGGAVAVATGPNEQLDGVLGWNSQANEYLVTWSEYQTETQKDIFGQVVSGYGPPDIPGTISGVAWLDRNGNGTQDIGEPGLVGVSIELFENGDQIGMMTTKNGGAYTFSLMPPGSYELRECHPAWVLFSSTTDVRSIAVIADHNSVVNFGDWNGIPIRLPLVVRSGNGSSQ